MMKYSTVYTMFFVVIAVMLCSTCNQKTVCTASIIIKEIIPPSTFNKPIYIGITDNDSASFITYGKKIEPGMGLSQIEITDIVFENKAEGQNFNDFWLFVAEDFNGTGSFDTNDRYIPFSRIRLTDRETLTINTIDFSMPVLFDATAQKYTLRILHSNPLAVNKFQKIVLTINDSNWFFFSDANVCKEIMFFFDGTLSIQVYWDSNGNNSLNAGEWVSESIYLSPLQPNFVLVLSPLYVQP